jgi:hypothetical protein
MLLMPPALVDALPLKIAGVFIGVVEGLQICNSKDVEFL